MTTSLGADDGAVLAGVALVASALGARQQRVGPIEERLFRAANRAPDELHAPAWVVMQAGSLGAVFVASAGLARRGRRQTALVTLVAGSAVWGGVKLVKPLIGRGRPESLLDRVSVRGRGQAGLGYPSGHAAVVTTLAILAGREAGFGTRAALFVVAGATGGARLYVGAHLPLDVAGGTAIGVLSARVARHVLQRRNG